MKFNKSYTLKKAMKIKAFLTYVDGVLTDGGIIYDNNGLELKKFNVKDGQIIKILRNFDFKIGVITGRNSPVVKNRCRELGIDFHKHGVQNKISEYNKFKELYNLNDEEVLYVGDDIIDWDILRVCGLSATPADARTYMKENVDLVTNSSGGEGVFRDLADHILDCQGLLIKLLRK